MARLKQRLVRTRIEPGVSASERHDIELSGDEVVAVDVGDLQLPASRWLERFRNTHYVVVVKVKAGYRETRFRLGGLFFDAHRAAVRSELDHAVALRVLYLVGEHRRAGRFFCRLLQVAREVVTVKNIVAQHQRAGFLPYEVLCDEKGLRDAARVRLHGVLEIEAPARAVTEQLLEARGVLRCGDHEDIADACEHQRAHRVVDHRLVVDRQKLLGHDLRHRVEARAAAPGKDDALHASPRLA